MSRTKLLIERYKRSNDTEQQVLINIVQQFPKIIIFDKSNTEIIVQQRIKRTSGNVRLFLDAETPNLTYKDNYRCIEFLVVDSKDNYHWFDAKFAKKSTNLTDLHGEYYRTKNNKGVVHFITDGTGYCSKVLDSHREYIKVLHIDDKIKIIPLSKLKEIANVFN